MTALTADLLVSLIQHPRAPEIVRFTRTWSGRYHLALYVQGDWRAVAEL